MNLRADVSSWLDVPEAANAWLSHVRLLTGLTACKGDHVLDCFSADDLLCVTVHLVGTAHRLSVFFPRESYGRVH